MPAVHMVKGLNTEPGETVSTAVFPHVRLHFGAAKFKFVSERR